VDGHRHLPEIEQGLTDICGQPVQLTFVPHLLPINRGILSTIYVDLQDESGADYQQLFENAYAREPFVDVLPAGEQPTLRSVKGSNMCRIGVARPQGRNKLVITVAEDNLTKGASGQAIQNMNIMFGINESEGLASVALMP
ncbi:MAG: Asd/ArgC dimerization domain-containing protein, partial [Pseudomonadales bacterium]